MDKFLISFKLKFSCFIYNYVFLEIRRTSAIPFGAKLPVVLNRRCNERTRTFENDKYICAGSLNYNICDVSFN